MTASVTALPPPFRLTAEMIVRYYLANIDRLEHVVVMATFKDTPRPMVSMTEVDPTMTAWLGATLLRMATEPPTKKAPAEGPSEPIKA